MTESFLLNAGSLLLPEIQHIITKKMSLKLSEQDQQNVARSANIVSDFLKENKTIYGVNTGFGVLAKQRISTEKAQELQRRLILSHAAGSGEYLADNIVQCILLLKINSLARGFSGVRQQLLDHLLALFNHQVYPCIPAKGSVGASGDLAPLAHIGCALIGEGEVRHQGKIMPALQGLKIAGLSPLQFAAKEGLALINGTQVSTALAIMALFKVHNLFAAALVAGAMSNDASLGSDIPFSEVIQQLRGQSGQILVAQQLRQLLTNSEIRVSHSDCERVQDPYSLRCQPQVMGSCLDVTQYASKVLACEANAVTDNPILMPRDKQFLNGGNFHAAPIAMAADCLALAIAEIGAIAERRIALLVDERFSQLPAFLVSEQGLNSGFMIAHVTAAALASENKSLAHPAGVDSIPTSANQEDHVSMATFAARRLHEMVDNTITIVAIELLAACQGIDLRRPLQTSTKLQAAHRLVRNQVEFYEHDRYFATDIEKVKAIIYRGEFNQFVTVNIID